MAKSPKKDESGRSKQEAQALFEHTVRRMLSTPPKPHKPAGAQHRKQKRAATRRKLKL
jgi:hypothetical protein